MKEFFNGREPPTTKKCGIRSSEIKFLNGTLVVNGHADDSKIDGGSTEDPRAKCVGTRQRDEWRGVAWRRR